MSELKTITLDGTDYSVADMTDQQKGMLAQITDTSQKLEQLQFQAQQLAVAKDAFIGMLKQSLTVPAETVAETAPQA